HEGCEVTGGEVCYETLGCFTDDKPYSGTPQRPKAALPWTPKKIGARFLLFTPENPTKHQVIRADSIASIESSNFKTTRKTCIIIHGMADKAEDSWVSKMCNVITMDDVNCIGVDWRRGSGNIAIYVQAANNARLVGAVVAHFLKIIQVRSHMMQAAAGGLYSCSSIHLIGHSLGAHAAGETGKRYSGIWKITGLDPAHPYFEDTPAEVRLDTSDAFFVEVMHTDTGSPLGVGIKNPNGHRDIYPNGGKQMPGCPNKISAITLVDILACNHLRAIHYYTASIRHPGGFLAYPCDSYKAFKEGSCFPCPAPGCPLMGYFSNSSHSVTSPQSYYLHTSWRYKLSVTLRGTSVSSLWVHVVLVCSRGDFFPGNIYSSFLDVDFEVISVTRVTFSWSLSHFNLFQHTLGAARIDFQRGRDGNISSFCTDGTVPEHVIQTLLPC
uniref:Triacylglycerol lipase n=1 Tax=Leptobrachium leishanense TaxID=445787 RepID=A0A8C5MDU1_9ANUR